MNILKKRRCKKLLKKESFLDLAKKLEEISLFLTNAADEENYYRKQNSIFDEEIQDYLHEIEMCNLSRTERSSVLKNIKISRNKRRDVKDILEYLDPITRFTKSSNNIQVQLLNLSKKIIEVNEGHNKRYYLPRRIINLKLVKEQNLSLTQNKDGSIRLANEKKMKKK
jgi:hypothetical protein